MPTARDFAYSTGSAPSGSTKFGNIVVGKPTNGFVGTGVNWWGGPDEDLGYIIAKSNPIASWTTRIGVNSNIGFSRSLFKTEESFLSMVNNDYVKSFTTGSDAKTWLNQNGYWTSWGEINRNGLVMALDADNSDSSKYGGGSYWLDLSGNGNHATKYNGVSLGTRGNAKCFVLDSPGKYFSAPLNNGNLSTNATLEAWIYPENEITSGDRGCIFQTMIYMSWNKSNQNLSNYWYGKSLEGYHEAGVSNSRYRWHHFVSVWNYDEGKLYQYVNGSLIGSFQASGVGRTVGSINMGWEGNARQFSGAFAVMNIYNKALTPTEVINQYNSYKIRFS